MKNHLTFTLNKMHVFYLFLLLIALGGCKEDYEGKSVDVTPTVSPAYQVSPAPLVTPKGEANLIINSRYWVTANPVGNGKFGYFIGISDQQNDVISHSFVPGTNVSLLEVSDNKNCKVEGPETTNNQIIQGWIPCERLVSFEPTPVPEDLYIKSP